MKQASDHVIALIIPTWNAEKDLPYLFAGIMQQTLQPQHILFVDSSSTDKTRELLAQYPVKVHVINQREFDHGGTRKLATTLVDADIYILMTQDAYPATPDTFANLIKDVLSDDMIACAYGRQLPKIEADPLSAHGRFFNYPEQSVTRYAVDKAKYGIKTCFNSNNLAAYKKSILDQVGGFPARLITAEDAYVAGRMLQLGFGIRYAADAVIYHSHNFNWRQEFHRYFSIGVFHKRADWIIETFSSASSEGWRYIQSEFNFLWKNKHYTWIPRAFLSTLAKYIGYHMGLRERWIPWRIKKAWGVNKSFWLKQ